MHFSPMKYPVAVRKYVLARRLNHPLHTEELDQHVDFRHTKHHECVSSSCCQAHVWEIDRKQYMMHDIQSPCIM